ncbi:unnamed protein product, partial [marine sediment metagenome]
IPAAEMPGNRALPKLPYKVQVESATKNGTTEVGLPDVEEVMRVRVRERLDPDVDVS